MRRRVLILGNVLAAVGFVVVAAASMAFGEPLLMLLALLALAVIRRLTGSLAGWVRRDPHPRAALPGSTYQEMAWVTLPCLILGVILLVAGGTTHPMLEGFGFGVLFGGPVVGCTAVWILGRHPAGGATWASKV